MEDYKTVDQIVRERGFDPETVKKMVKMIERSEYKRQQAAPVLRISPKAFGQGRRFPIAAKIE